MFPPACAAIPHFHPHVSGKQQQAVRCCCRRHKNRRHNKRHAGAGYLRADPCCGFTQRQYGDVLGSVQPVDGQFGGRGPFHHGHIVFTNKARVIEMIKERLAPLTFQGKMITETEASPKCFRSLTADADGVLIRKSNSNDLW